MKDHHTFTRNRQIAFICFSSSLGGLELSMLRLASELTKRKAECIIIVPPHTPLASQAAEYGLKVLLLKPRWKYGDIAASMRLADIFKSHKIDIAVLMQSKDMSIVTLAQTVRSSVKLVFYQEMQSGIDKRDILHTWMYSKLSLWITLTNRMKQEVLTHTRMPESRIIVVPIGTDIGRFNPGLIHQIDARKQFGIPTTKLVIGVLGRLDPQKGQKEFIESIPSLVKQQSDLHFVIAGDATPGQEEYKQQLTDLTQRLEVNQYIQFLPFTDAVPEFMSAIDIFVLPSYCETFGFVLIEAMAMEKAIIATNAGGVTEIIRDSITGILVPPRNITALGAAMETLLKNPEKRASLSTQARADALHRFDIAYCVDQLVSAFQVL